MANPYTMSPARIVDIPYFAALTLFQNDKLLEKSQTKSLNRRQKINVTQKLKSDLEWIENVVGKGKNAGYQLFLFGYYRLFKELFF